MNDKPKATVHYQIGYNEIDELVQKIREFTVSDPTFTEQDLLGWMKTDPMKTRAILDAMITWAFVMHVRPKVVKMNHTPNVHIYRCLEPKERLPLLKQRIDHLKQQKDGITRSLEYMEIAVAKLTGKGGKNEKNIS